MIKQLLLNSIFLLGTLISYAQWQPDVRLTNDPALSATTAYSNARCIASSGDTVHVVFRDNRLGGNYEIFYKRSVDGGLTWGPDTRISNNVFFSSNPSISISGSVVLVVWEDNRDGATAQDYQIYYNRSSDGGNSWGTDMRLTYDATDAENPSVAASGLVVLVVWNHRDASSYTGIYYKRSVDGGISWGDENHLDGKWFPVVSLSGQVAHLVWTDQLGVNPGIYYNRSTDGGITWGVAVPLTINDVAYSDSPSLAVSGSDVNVVFRDSRNSTGTGYEIFYKHSTDGGLSWSADKQLSNSNVTVYNPSVSVSGSGVHAVWTDNHEGIFKIYYDGSADGGLSWETVKPLSTGSAVSFYPFVSSSGSAVHVIWQDNRDGNYEIYYKRNATGNPVGMDEVLSSRNPIRISPNPFANEITVTNNVNEPCEIRIYDITSRKTIQKKFAGTATLNTSSLKKGIYIFEVRYNNTILRKGKIIKD